MVRQTTKVIIFEVFGVISLLLMAAVALIAVRLASGPFELGIFRDDVEAALTQARGGREVDLETLTLQWSPSERRVFLVARGVSLKDINGDEAGHAEQANITLDAGAILLGDIEVLSVDMLGGMLDLRNTAPNVWTLAGEPLPPIPEGELPQTPEEWLDRTNSVLGAVLGGLSDTHGTLDFEALAFADTTLRFFDIEGGEVGRIDGAESRMQRLEQDIAFTLSGRGEGIGLPGEFSASLETSGGYGNMVTEVTVSNWPLVDLARRLQLPGFETGGLTADITMAAIVEREAGLVEVDLAFDQQEGALILPVQEEVLQDVDFELGYIIADDAVNINRLAVQTTRADIEMTGRLSNVLAQNALRRIDADFSRFNLDATPVFPTPWTFSDVDVSADLSDDFTIAVIRRLNLPLGGADLRASGEIDFVVDHEDGELPFSLDLTAEIEGDLTKDMVLNYWPERLGDGARRFVVRQLEEGIVNELRASVEIRPDSLAQGHLRDEDLNVEFGFRNGRVYFLRDLPPIENAIGTAKLGGNSFSVSVVSATYDDWEISTGSVDFAAFMPRGENIIVQAEGNGPAVSILRHLSESRLRLEENTGFDPERVSGQATSQFYMTRPALDRVPFEDIFLRVNGTIADAGLKNVAWGMDLTGGTVQVDLTQERLILTGSGDVGPAPAQFTWRDGLTNDGLPSDLSASAILTNDILNSLGLTGRAYLSGEIPVELQGKVDNGSLDVATLGFDLREARIDIGEIGWVKPAGDLARATLSYRGDDTAQASTVRLESETAAVDGDLLLDPVGRFQALTLRRLFVDGTADVAGRIERTGQTGLDVEFSGAFLDVSSFIPDIGGLGEAAGSDVEINLNLLANVDRLRLRRGLDLTNASVTVESDENGLSGVAANGDIAGGAKLSANYLAGDGTAPPTMSMRAGNAGFLAEALLGIEFMRGGDLQMEGTLGTGGAPTRIIANVKDVQLSNAPVFTQILSLASLRGLADTLSGDGVMFSNVVAPISIGGGRYVIDGGRASGPALGLTVNGWIATDGSGIDLNGVLVPSFGVNSVLGGVPIIGDLVVGRQGEGIFSINYGVNGSLERAQVSVNPLSAVTPGILRRIFENPADTSIPDSLPVDPDLRPPQPKLPDFGDEEFIEPTPGAG
ncbi:MAG: AsmA-like C-terminal region-containing protein [Pseudomonadota bacterium]